MRRSTTTALLAVVLLTGLYGAARGDLIFLKDGYVLQGRVRREGINEWDATGKDFHWVPRGFFFVDDGPRRIFFSPSQVSIVEKLSAPAEERVVRREVVFLSPRPMLPVMGVVEATPWDNKTWKREYYFRSNNAAKVGCKQALAELTPFFARLDAITKFQWSSGYLTRELGPDVVYQLLRGHPELQDDYVPPPPRRPFVRRKPGEKAQAPEKPKPPEKPTVAVIAARRMRICDFLVQAGWFDLADKELDRLLRDYPDQRKRVESARALLARQRSRDEWEEIKHWYHAGRYDAVHRRLETFSTKHASDRIKADVRELQARLARSADMIEQAAKALDVYSKEAGSTANGRSLASAAALIRKEIHPATVDRLDTFLSQVREARRQKTRGKKQTLSAENLLALAVTGWLLGSPSAESDPRVAINLWKTRQLVLAYCQETDYASRQRQLAKYENEVTPRVDLDEIAQLIGNLPPVEPPEKTSTEPTEVKVGKGRGGSTYHLVLPPEYTPGHSYPVLFVLHDADEKPATMLARWSKAAADHGYILAAPEWERGFANRYQYSEREHDTVLDALRDLRRRFQVDSDRVFLFGLGEGGKMAFDVGLAHPDLFAGVIPMGAGPNYYSRRYWRNAQYLPFYVINGTRAGDNSTQLREQFTHWVQRAYPTLWVEYKGRGLEWLGGEVPHIFDWMRNQRRVFPLYQLGTSGNGTEFGNEFCTMRPEDNRFYWLSSSEINPGSLVTTRERWSNLVQPASLTARIDSSTNEIILRTSGLNQVTIWLGRNPKGQYMIDFDRPVTVRAGLRPVWVNRKVMPSLRVMLEDLYRRGDRKHLFQGRIDVPLR
jgi:pimeloyl-ACP methyl ester carboxylesterase